jgi:hypothetical protein
MAFVLSENRSGTARELQESFERYRLYLVENKAIFPPSAFQLASSDWYFSLSDQRSPHDGWLEDFEVFERDQGAQTDRAVGINVRVRSVRQDRYLDFYYPRVYSYRIELIDGRFGHRDWRYDEFRLSDAGHVVHEIEWAGPVEVARWIIVASDVHLSHRPIAAKT